MKQRIYFYGLLGLMGACGAAVAMGNLAPDVSLESAREIWADVLRDVDEFGLHATRIPVHKEMQVGADMARQSVWGAEDAEAAKYVAAVGQGLVGNVNRKAMRYQFHVIRSHEVNAFALPGGQIYVLRGMLDFLHSEAELAAILGHEISHVDLRHCVERYQYQLALKKIGAGDAGPLVEIAHGLVAIGYSQDQELEADASGERLAIEAGYDPDAAAAVFHRMQTAFGESAREPAKTPLGEAGEAVGGAIVSYFRTHPPSEQRARQLSEMVAANRKRLAGRTFYRGAENYKLRVAWSEREFPAEKRVY
ncbi:MAG: M48 family metallopeptidase [Acidobacteriia bacterium]|nr:M48 family metallopeptidase [Terriglobia bacterium]